MKQNQTKENVFVWILFGGADQLQSAFRVLMLSYAHGSPIIQRMLVNGLLVFGVDSQRETHSGVL